MSSVASKKKQTPGSSTVEELDEVLAVIPVPDFAPLVLSQVQQSSGTGSGTQTLTQFIQQLQSLHPGKRVAVAVLGLDKYYSDQKLSAKRKHREEVTGQKAKGARKGHSQLETAVTRFQVEEAVVSAQLQTGCCCHLVDNAQEVAELVKTFTKATIDKPNKKDRFDSVFTFLEEGGTGVKCEKDGKGLLKVWRLQLQQLHNLGPEMAAAIAAEYPSPLALMQAYADYPNPAEAWKVTENIVVRRGAGVLETGRRVGQQLSRRIHTLMTSTDPDKLVK
ncbi:hypothetical protein BaRGS_00017511 [Batillaria attramentaria]|uniref:ERCC4 domain-containing protein n=1 Tax=Batillaria attramentaria TaxID=370345 RepID=A0ABD0KVP3_9CAEN